MSATDNHAASAGISDQGQARRRILALARANTLLMMRNKLTMTYAVLVPLLPLALLFTVDLSDPVAGAGALVITLILTLLFPVFYNLLSIVVTRRDELVLKRLRTGETRDWELVTALALPGCLLAVLLSVLTVAIAVPVGVPLPTNALLYAVAVLAGIVMVAAFAMWTAAWTRNAEAAQITSAPVMVLMVVGQLAVSLPESVREVLIWTPGAAITSLVRTGWFGLEPIGTGPLDQESTLGFVGSWGAAAQPLLVLAAWTVLAVVLARRSMQWEPRS